jgi:single-strand DNA-binding protein
MTGFNKVILMGNLTRDPQLKYLPSQTPVAEFGLAVNRRYKTAQGEDKEDVVFVELTAFGKQAETINQYCQKGKPLFVEGRLKYDQWDDKETGQKRSKLSVVVDTFQFVGIRDDSSASPAKREEQSLWKEQTPAKRAPEPRKGRQPVGAGAKYKESDIPF